MKLLPPPVVGVVVVVVRSSRSHRRRRRGEREHEQDQRGRAALVMLRTLLVALRPPGSPASAEQELVRSLDDAQLRVRQAPRVVARDRRRRDDVILCPTRASTGACTSARPKPHGRPRYASSRASHSPPLRNDSTRPPRVRRVASRHFRSAAAASAPTDRDRGTASRGEIRAARIAARTGRTSAAGRRAPASSRRARRA